MPVRTSLGPLTLAALEARYAGRSGVWLAHSAPARDELGSTTQLGYYEGLFEEVLAAVLEDHRRLFTDGDWCGEIELITPKRVGGAQLCPHGVLRRYIAEGPECAP